MPGHSAIFVGSISSIRGVDRDRVDPAVDMVAAARGNAWPFKQRQPGISGPFQPGVPSTARHVSVVRLWGVDRPPNR